MCYSYPTEQSLISMPGTTDRSLIQDIHKTVLFDWVKVLRPSQQKIEKQTYK